MDILEPTRRYTDNLTVEVKEEPEIPPVEWSPDILVVGPGTGCECSILHVLYNGGLLDNVRTFVGVGTSSILCLLLCIGYSPDEIARAGGDLAQLEHMAKRRVNSASLADIERQTRKVFVSVTSNLTSNTTEYLSHFTEPNLGCIQAAMMSLPEKRRYKGMVYSGKRTHPYPVDAFDDGTVDILGVSVNNDQILLQDLVREKTSIRCKHIHAIEDGERVATEMYPGLRQTARPHTVVRSTFSCTDIDYETDEIVEPPDIPDVSSVIRSVFKEDQSRGVHLLQLAVDWLDGVDVGSILKIK